MTPTQRSLDYLRKSGYICGVVERWIPMGFRKGIRKDLYGFIDLVAMKRDRCGLLGIQTTSGTNFAKHLNKILGNEELSNNAIEWLLAGNRIHLHGWRKVGKHGKRKTYEVRVKVIDLSEVTNGKNTTTYGGVPCHGACCNNC